MNELDALTRDYRTAFLRYLPRHEEAALTRGYELGRGAVTAGVSMFDLTRIHHEVLLEVLRDTRPEEVIDVASAASESSISFGRRLPRVPCPICRGIHTALSRKLGTLQTQGCGGSNAGCLA